MLSRLCALLNRAAAPGKQAHKSSCVTIDQHTFKVPAPGVAQKLSGQSPKAPREEPASGPSWFQFGGPPAAVRGFQDAPLVP